jgi:hypothetical protein
MQFGTFRPAQLWILKCRGTECGECVEPGLYRSNRLPDQTQLTVVADNPCEIRLFEQSPAEGIVQAISTMTVVVPLEAYYAQSGAVTCGLRPDPRRRVDRL